MPGRQMAEWLFLVSEGESGMSFPSYPRQPGGIRGSLSNGRHADISEETSGAMADASLAPVVPVVRRLPTRAPAASAPLAMLPSVPTITPSPSSGSLASSYQNADTAQLSRAERITTELPAIQASPPTPQPVPPTPKAPLRTPGYIPLPPLPEPPAARRAPARDPWPWNSADDSQDFYDARPPREEDAAMPLPAELAESLAPAPPLGSDLAQASPQQMQPHWQAGPPVVRPSLPQGSPAAHAQHQVSYTLTAKANHVAAFSYLLGIFTGIPVYIAEPQNRFVRFHALQSIMLGSVLIVYGCIIAFLTYWMIQAQNSLLTVFAVFFAVIMLLAGAAVWLWAFWSAFQGKTKPLPFIGEKALKYAEPEDEGWQ